MSRSTSPPSYWEPSAEERWLPRDPHLRLKQPPVFNIDSFVNSLSCTLCITRSSSRRVTIEPEENPSTQTSSFATWILPLKVPGVQHVRGPMKIPAKMAEQRGSVSLSPLVPFSRHFDVMGALYFVMWRSCQISGPVMALSACLLGLTEPVMELRLNKRVITFPVLDRTTLSYAGRRGEGVEASIPPCPPSVTIKKIYGWEETPSDY